MLNDGGSGALTSRELVERGCVAWRDDLRDFLLGVLKRPDLADEACQRTVVQALEHSASVRPETLRGWLFTIALNEARQIRRSDRRARELFSMADWEVSAGLVSAGLASADRASGGIASEAEGVGRRLDEAERAHAVSMALGRLPDRQREVVVRRVWKNQTFAEIAESMQSPLGSVLTWMRRALEQLRSDEALKELGDGDV